MVVAVAVVAVVVGGVVEIVVADVAFDIVLG